MPPPTTPITGAIGAAVRASRVLLNFPWLPFQPGDNLNRFDVEHSFPTPTHPELTMDSATWLREHVQHSRAEVAAS